ASTTEQRPIAFAPASRRRTLCLPADQSESRVRSVVRGLQLLFEGSVARWRPRNIARAVSTTSAATRPPVGGPVSNSAPRAVLPLPRGDVLCPQQGAH